MHLPIIFLSILVNLIVCRDFYVGMFKRNDFLVAQDRFYKERVYNGRVTAKYGRIFKCPITYFRVVDRLGIGWGPSVKILRGGLRKKYLVLRLVSMYNYPISVNIYVGCENKMTRQTTVLPTTDSETTGNSEDNITVTQTTAVTNASIDSPKNASMDENTVTDETSISNTTVDNNSTRANKTD